MRKRWPGFGVIFLLAGLLIGLHLCLRFYMLLPISPQLFSLRHHYFSHLELYTDRYHTTPGDAIEVHISCAPASNVTLTLTDLFRRDTLKQEVVEAKFQPLRDSAAIYGADWDEFSFLLPEEMETGWYVLEASANQQSKRTSLFVQPKKGRAKKKIAWLLSTNTWNAYNPWGGFSLYSRAYTPTVSFQRPQPLSDPYMPASLENHQLYFQAATKDLYLAQLMDSAGLGFDVYDMMAFEKADSRLWEYELIIFATHTEYWTEAMLENLNQLLDSGASVMNLAGNVAAYQSFLDSTKQTLTVHKSPQSLWLAQDTTGLRPFGTEIYLMGYHTYAPYEIKADTSWLFEETDLRKGKLLGEKSDTYDYTYMYGGVWDQLSGLFNRNRMSAASGLEIDRTYYQTPENWVTIARGLNPNLQGQGQVWPDPSVEWDGKGGADLGYYVHPGGGMVFGVGSMAFTGAIPYDTNLRQLLVNFLRKCAKDQ